MRSLPNQAMYQDLDEVLAWMESNPDPPQWLEEYPRAIIRISYWLGEMMSNLRAQELELDRIKAVLDEQIRQEIVDNGGKPTEDRVRRLIRGNAAYTTQAGIIAATRGMVSFLRGFRASWDQDLLVQLSVNWRAQGAA